MKIRKELIQDRVENLGNDISTLKLNSKNIKEIINDYPIMSAVAFSNKYPRLDMTIDELACYRRLINKKIKALKESDR